MDTVKICRPYITINGVRKYAKDYGKKAWCWEVSREKHEAYLKQQENKASDDTSQT